MNSSGRKRIAIFSAVHLPNVGGVERFTDRLSRELSSMGHEVWIVTNDTYRLGGRERTPEGVEVVRLPCFSLMSGRMPLPRPGRGFCELFHELSALTFDGVLVNTRFYLHSLMGMRFARSQGLQAVVLDHGSAYLTFGNTVLDAVERVYEHAITAIGKSFHPAYYGISDSSVRWLRTFDIEARGVLGNSIDALAYRESSSGRDFRTEFSVPADHLLLAFTGRFIPEKGISSLLGAMQSLANRKVTLLMAGDGPMVKDVQVAALPHVHLLGRLDQPDIAALLLSADAFCLPSRSEGFCTSLLEACACGTPSIIPDVGGVAELMPGPEYGTVLPDTSIDSLVFAIEHAIDNRAELALQGKLCRERVERLCSWRATADGLLAAFDFAG